MNNLITCVSCYFNVKNKHNNKYLDWFNNTLSINAFYVFFTNDINLIKKYRKNLPTYYIECNISDFYTWKYKDKIRIDDVHCPSIELNLIWNEKIFMIEKAFNINPFNSEYFMWVDSGICTYRDIKPPQNHFDMNKIIYLPKNKFIFSSSDDETYYDHLVTNTNYYHYISGTYIIHKSFLNIFVSIYKIYLEKLLNKNNIWTDQLILTHIYKDFNNIFYKLCHGYGSIIKYLY